MKKTRLAIIFTSLILVMSIAGSLLFLNNVNGSIRLFKTAITINFKDNIYTYNDEELDTLNYTISDGNLFNGDKLKFTFKNPIKNAGIYNHNYFTYSIYSQNGVDVTSSYIVNENFEDIVINKRPITVKTASAVGRYLDYVQGTVSFKTISIAKGTLCEGHSISASGFRTSFYVGTFDNTCNVTIKNSTGSTVNKNYDISFYNGTLFVLATGSSDSGNTPVPTPNPDPTPKPDEDKDDDDNDEDSYNYLDRGEKENKDDDEPEEDDDSKNNASNPGLALDKDIENEPETYISKEEMLEKLSEHVFYYNKKTYGNHFLREDANTGTYDKNRFLKVEPYQNKDGFNPDEFVTYLLKNKVEHHLGTMDYSESKSREYDIHLNYPVYNQEQENDLYPVLSDLKSNTLDLEGLNYDYLENPSLIDNLRVTNQTFIKAEKEYREYAYENYLGIDEETSSFLKDYIKENNLKGNSIYEISQKLLTFFATNFQYQMWELECTKSDYQMISFLRDTKIGKCSQFATASTLIFRSLGYPARTISGYSVNGFGIVDVTGLNGHAKTQVYYDGIGWIDLEFTVGTPVEGTPSLPFQEDDEDDVKIGLKIVSESDSKTYDGTPLRNSSFTIEGEENLKSGHQIYTFCNNSITNAGTIENKVDYFILDSNLKDVSNQYKVSTEFGNLIVNKKELEISTGNIKVSFDNQYEKRFISYSGDQFIEGDDIAGMEVVTYKEKGTYLNKIIVTKIINKYGDDITNNYEITYDYGMMEVV